MWEPDPDIEAMTSDFRQALARLVPVFMPDLLFRLGGDGQRVHGVEPNDGPVQGGDAATPGEVCEDLALEGAPSGEVMKYGCLPARPGAPGH